MDPLDVLKQGQVRFFEGEPPAPGAPLTNKPIVLDRYGYPLIVGMTVKALRDALADLPDEAFVIAEGCDCANAVRAVIRNAAIPPDTDDDDTPSEEAWKFENFPEDAIILRVML